MFNLLKMKLNKIIVILVCFVFFLNIFVIHADSENSDNMPDLSIESVDYDQVLTEGIETSFLVNLKNVGNKNISNENLQIFLFKDQIPNSIIFNSSIDSVDIGESISLRIDWTPGFGDDEDHVLKVFFNYNKIFEELSYENNLAVFHVKINKKETELGIDDLDIPERFILNKTSNIKLRISNVGQSTDDTVKAKLKSNLEDDSIILEKKGLDSGQTYAFQFNFTPSNLGVHTLNFEIFVKDDLHDSRSLDVTVSVGNYEWWNENWHYRYLISLEGSGNFSKFFNFTQILNDIGLYSKSFEKDTLRITQYSDDGEFINEVKNFSFNETNGFDNKSNAAGILEWDTNIQSDFKTYLIYFDVFENIGARSSLPENFIGEKSNDIDVIFDDIYESWWIEVLSPSENDIILVGDNINISINSVAKIESSQVFIYHNEDRTHNYTFYLDSSSDKLLFYNDSFSLDKEGNWTIDFICLDYAGLSYNLSYVFYVGQPDLITSDLKVYSKEGKSFSNFYLDDTLNISVDIESILLSLNDVDVTLSIEDNSENSIYNQTREYDFIKNEEKSIYFEWKANISGSLNVNVVVDSSNEIEEKTESNNKISEAIFVKEWSDLVVNSVIFPDYNITEFDKVNIDIVVKNQGLGDAEDSKISLFIEKKSGNNPVMLFDNEVDSGSFNVGSNSSKKVSLIWDSAKAGDFYVGVKIFDINYYRGFFAYTFTSVKTLSVSQVESIPPVINNISIYPDYPVIGQEIVIEANIFDSSNLKNVSINITDPDGSNTFDYMLRTHDDYFEYIYDKTDEIGIYSYEITAIDSSLKNNINIKKGSFEINDDDIKPEIKYIRTDPFVQLAGENLAIYCTCTDNIEVSKIEVNIFSKDNMSVVEEMSFYNGNEYVYNYIYEVPGKYWYYIEAEDESGNKIRSNEEIFWITNDLNDTDGDGLSDMWEDKHGFNRYDPNDAEEDIDSDGYTNLEEFNMGTNPRKDIMLENVAYNIRENIWYLIISSIIFFLIVLIFYRLKKRRITA